MISLRVCFLNLGQVFYNKIADERKASIGDFMSGVLYLSFIIYLNYLNQKLALVFLYPSLHLHPLGKIWHGVLSYPLSEDHRSLR